MGRVLQTIARPLIERGAHDIAISDLDVRMETKALLDLRDLPPIDPEAARSAHLVQSREEGSIHLRKGDEEEARTAIVLEGVADVGHIEP